MGSILLADIVVTVHLAIMFFVVIGQVLIVAGWLLRWQWVRNFWFRTVHLLSILVIAGQALLGVECPLTTLERHWRGGAGYLHDLDNASAIGRLSNEILYFRFSPRLFLILYSTFALLVLLTWAFAPPRWPWGRNHSSMAR